MSLFVFFNALALNQWLQYGAKGRWQAHLFGEKASIALAKDRKGVERERVLR